MKMLAILILSLLTIPALAPSSGVVFVGMNEPIQPYEAFWKIIVTIESKGDALAFNPVEQAYGVAQIRAVRLNDYVKKTGNKLTLKDCYDYKTSKAIFMFYMSQFRPDDIFGMCVSWNGKSVKNKYYKKVQNILQNQI